MQKQRKKTQKERKKKEREEEEEEMEIREEGVHQRRRKEKKNHAATWVRSAANWVARRDLGRGATAACVAGLDLARPGS